MQLPQVRYAALGEIDVGLQCYACGRRGMPHQVGVRRLLTADDDGRHTACHHGVDAVLPGAVSAKDAHDGDVGAGQQLLELAVDQPRRVRPPIARPACAGGDQVGVGRRQQQHGGLWHPPLLPHPQYEVRSTVGMVSATFAAGTPHPSLRGVVLRYEGYEERAAGPVTIRELPCTFVPVIIDLDAGWTVAHRQHAAPLRLGSFVAGVTDGPVLVGHDGSARCLQVDLTPLGARRLVGLPMSELANQSVPIDVCWVGSGVILCSGWATHLTGRRDSR